MERRRVLPDVNVCYPISLLDLVLRLDENDFHEVIWTDDLLDELARVGSSMAPVQPSRLRRCAGTFVVRSSGRRSPAGSTRISSARCLAAT
jgi:hypothetical protein